MTVLDDYKEFTTTLTDAPDVFHEYMGYAMMGTLLGRNVHFPFGSINIYPNFYLVLIAPSSRFRKSTALTLASRIINEIDPKRILPDEFSQEKLVEELSINSVGSFFFYEFKTLLGMLERDYMQGAKAFLTGLFDCLPSYRRKTKQGEFEIKNPAVSILAATTMNWFSDMIKQGDLEGGFLNRFIFIPAYKKERNMPIPPKMNMMKLDNIVYKIKDLLMYMKDKEMTMTDEARDIYCNWYNASVLEIELENDNSMFSASATRMQIYLIKFAMLNAIIDDRSTIIDTPHMMKGIKSVDWLLKNAKKIIREDVTSNKFHGQTNKVKSTLTRLGGTCSWRTLLQNSHIKSKELMEVVLTMEESGELKRTMEKDKDHGMVLTLLSVNT